MKTDQRQVHLPFLFVFFYYFLLIGNMFIFLVTILFNASDCILPTCLPPWMRWEQLKWFTGLRNTAICHSSDTRLHTVLSSGLYGLKRRFTYLKLDKEAWCTFLPPCQPSFFSFIICLPSLNMGIVVIGANEKMASNSCLPVVVCLYSFAKMPRRN